MRLAEYAVVRRGCAGDAVETTRLALRAAIGDVGCTRDDGMEV